MIVSNLLFVSLITLALGKPDTRDFKVHETLAGPPSGFSRIRSADPDQTLNLRLALVQGNAAELERKLYDVSTPSSPSYGKHLSMSEVNQLVAPTQESVDAINAWLKENGIVAKTVSPSGDWLSFEVPVSKANEVFDADFSVFEHNNTGMEAVRALSYSIPAKLQGHLDLVHPTVTFPNPWGQLPVPQVLVRDTSESSGQNLSSQATPSSCSKTITPACLQAIYNIPRKPATQTRSNRLAVTGFNEQYANEADLKDFLSTYRPDMPSDTTFTLQTIDGGSNPQDLSQAGFAANLDIQYTVGVATGVPTSFISVGQETIDGYIDVANFLLSQNNPPKVLMTSYAFNESQISPNVARNLCNLYAALGARGVSVLYTSGFGGVSGAGFSSIPINACTSFVPTFPSTCPFVTSVGSSQGVPEVAANSSAGGFSNIFNTPDYQTSAVNKYLSALGSTYDGRFNRSGRAYPDISAQGFAYELIVGGNLASLNGTASMPVFASIVSLLNDRLLAQGQAPLGFLNPFLYTVGAAALNDIKNGSNPGCNTDGFPAGEGWDPVTGLGTPDFERLAFTLGL